jgi:hypothetical protein
MPDLTGSFCTKWFDRNCLGKELGHAEDPGRSAHQQLRRYRNHGRRQVRVREI